MLLKKVKLKNFRCYKDEVVIEMDSLVVFLGKNDAGKSSVLDALEVFFETKSTPDSEDLCVHNDDGIIKITCCFEPAETQIILDEDYQTTLENEYLLNSDGLLEITKEYDCKNKKPKLSRVTSTCNHPSLDDMSDLLSLKITDLRTRAKKLAVDISAVNKSIKSEIRKAIWTSQSDLNLSPIEIILDKGETKSLWDRIKPQLPVFSLFRSDRPSTDQDSEAQDPMKTAIKQAISDQSEALVEITELVKKRVKEIADRTVEKVSDFDPNLANQLDPHISTRNWDTLFSVSLTGDESIPINKRGSGTRRLILLSFFRAEAERHYSEDGTGVIYAIEEPETSQHPNNQMKLIEALEELSQQPKVQVIVTTHTPNLARRFNEKSLLFVENVADKTVVTAVDEDKARKKVIKSLGILPNHDIRVFLGVEGRNDINFLHAITKILSQSDSNIVDLEEAEKLLGHLVFIPLGGSSLDLWIAKLNGLQIPEYYIIDRDTPPPEQPKYHDFQVKVNNLANCTAQVTTKRETENYINPKTIQNHLPNYQGTGDHFEDVPQLYAQAVHEGSNSPQMWTELTKDKKDKKESRAKKALNSTITQAMTVEEFHAADHNGELYGWLKEISVLLKTS